MKKYAWALLVLGLASCKKDTDNKNKYTCKHTIDYTVPVWISFGGFAEAELDTLIVSSYTGGTGFTDLLETDTLFPVPPLVFFDDLAYPAPARGFYPLKDNTDFKVAVVSTGRVFTVTVAKGDPTSYEWTKETPCTPADTATQTRLLTGIQVDGQPTTPYRYQPYVHYVALRK